MEAANVLSSVSPRQFQGDRIHCSKRRSLLDWQQAHISCARSPCGLSSVPSLSSTSTPSIARSTALQPKRSNSEAGATGSSASYYRSSCSHMLHGHGADSINYLCARGNGGRPTRDRNSSMSSDCMNRTTYSSSSSSSSSFTVEARRIVTVRAGSSGSRNHLYAFRAQAFPGDEAIGAEHGEGFDTFRSKGPLQVDVDFLNDRMRKRGVERIRLAMRPDEAFGLIFSWDNVIANTREVRWGAWRQLAEETGKPIADSPTVMRHLASSAPAHCIKSVLHWSLDPTVCVQMTDRLTHLYSRQLAKVRLPADGVSDWLQALHSAGVPCAVAASVDRLTLLAALDRMKLTKRFQAFVTAEDGMDSIAHRLLSAAVKLDRPPSQCVVFEDDPRGITAAHNCSMKAVAIIGTHPAYELKQADLAVTCFGDLSVFNLRRLFAHHGAGIEHMELKKQREEQGPRRRRRHTDTMY